MVIKDDLRNFIARGECVKREGIVWMILPELLDGFRCG